MPCALRRNGRLLISRSRLRLGARRTDSGRSYSIVGARHAVPVQRAKTYNDEGPLITQRPFLFSFLQSVTIAMSSPRFRAPLPFGDSLLNRIPKEGFLVV